jgi:hypothetical protein
MGNWRELHNEELRNLYSSSDVIRVMQINEKEMTENVACMGEVRDVYRSAT